MKKILYINNSRLPTEKANGIQIMHTCHALSKLGHQIDLVIPNRQSSGSPHQIFTFYRLKPNFTIKKIPCINLYRFPLPPSLHTLAHNLLVYSFTFFALLKYHHTQSIIYTRTKIIATAFSLIGKKVVFEAHLSSQYPWWDKIMAHKYSAVVGISHSIVKSWQAIHPKVIYAPDGVSPEFFKPISKATARKHLKLKLKQQIAVYTGNLYPWKGVDTIIKAAAKLPQIHFHLVGGSPEVLSQLAIKSSNVIHHLPVPPSEVIYWLKAADILIIPNSAKYQHSRQDTSPLKLFEYLASATPIIASKVPAISQVATSQHLTFFAPDNFSDLSHKIKKVLKTPAKHHQEAKKAQKLARNFTWSKRANTINQLFL